MIQPMTGSSMKVKFDHYPLSLKDQSLGLEVLAVL
jgi:hypothetical protein